MYKIAVIGAGPAGMTLARILLQSSVSKQLQVTIYEKDVSRSSRFSQGGCLDLHPPSGLAAIRRAGLWDEFSKYARYDGEEMRLGDLNGTIYVHMKGAPHREGLEERPEIDRERLKDVLLNSLPEHVIQWDKHLKAVNKEDRTLTFKDNTEAGPFDLVVGADGAWSKVRGVLTDVTPSYSGICLFQAKINQQSAGDRWGAIEKMIGRGSNFSYSGGHGITGQRMGDGTFTAGFARKGEQTWASNIIEESKGDEALIRKAIQKEFKQWHKSYQPWFESIHTIRPWPLFELPLDHQWEHQRHFTVIGDAANLMTPYAGEGANIAMRAGMELAIAIEQALSNRQDPDDNIAAFERTMFEWMHKSMARTRLNKDGNFAADAPVGFIADNVEIMVEEKGYHLNKGLLGLLPLKKSVYGAFWAIGALGSLRRKISDAVSKDAKQTEF